MQSFLSTHKKKQSNFSSTIGSRYELSKVNRSQVEPGNEKIDELLFKSECILERYRTKCEALETENKRYKKKYNEAIRKLRSF